MLSSLNCKKDNGHRGHLTLAGLISLFIIAPLLLSRPSPQARVYQTTSSRPGAQANSGKSAAGGSLPSTGAEFSAHLIENYGRLPLSFEVNRGQAEPEIKFLSRGSGSSLFFGPTEAVLALTVPVRDEKQESRAYKARQGGQDARIRRAVVRMQLIGANRTPQIEGVEELPGRTNYFRGNDPARWHTDVPTYAKVRYREVYPGVDLVYYGNQQQLEYDFRLASGTDPQAIRLSFKGAEKMEIDTEGDLRLHIAGVEIHQQRPVIYQEIGGRRQEIAGGYFFSGTNEVGFQIAPHDPSLPVVIDPVLVYSTFIGGSGDEIPFDIEVGADGSAYITGSTTSTDYPIVAETAAQTSFAGAGSGPGGSDFVGLGDVFVSRLNADATALIYSTYLGGSRDDQGLTLAMDGSSAAYVTGRTNSADFPTLSAFQPALGTGTCNFGGGDFPCYDAFVTKLSATGALAYSTYLGGDYYDDGRGIAVDAGGNAYITGNTHSTNFPTLNPIKSSIGIFQDSFVTKLNATGTALVYSTYLGGTSGSEAGQRVIVDSDGNAYIAGVTNTTDFPVVNAVQPAFGGGPLNPDGTGLFSDAYVTKIGADGTAILFSTYLGGSGTESPFRSIGLDSAHNIYVAGRTDSIDFPVTNAIQPAPAGGNDVFVVKLVASGNPITYSVGFSTYFGGSGNDNASSLATDAKGNSYIAGGTNSADFPAVNALQPAYGGGAADAFVVGLNPSGTSVLYSTYLGAGGTDRVTALALNSRGNVYLIGRTDSPAFPTANALQANFGGGIDAFVAKIIDAPESRGQCRNDGWRQFGPPAGPFRNQGECIRYFNTTR